MELRTVNYRLYSFNIESRVFLSFFSLFPALKLSNVATAMLENFGLGNKKINFPKSPHSYLE